MLAFWRNPEFVRHARAELRPMRVATAGAMAIVVPLLIGTGVYGNTRAYNQEFWRTLFNFLIGAQTAVLTLWTTLAAMQSISTERQQRTYDFVRTTRLTAGELLMGRLFGVAALAWVELLLTMIVSVPAALLGGVALWRVLLAYVIVVSLAILFTLAALAVSAAVEKPNPGIGMMLLFLLWIVSSAMPLATASFPGLQALSPVFALRSVLEEAGPYSRFGFYNEPAIFTREVPAVICALLLYWTLSAWLTGILLRMLKEDADAARPFSRRMAVGFVVYANALMLAFFRPVPARGYLGPGMPTVAGAGDLAAVMIALNLFLLYFVGIASAENAERLRVWFRQRGAAMFGEMQWPWIAAAAAGAYVLLIAEMMPLRSIDGFQTPPTGWAALNLLVAVAFAVRDTMFVQWCRLTRMKSATAKAVAWLVFYYLAIGIMVPSMTPKHVGKFAGGIDESFLNAGFNLLTPFRLFYAAQDASVMWSVYAGIVIQFAVAFLLWRAIRSRLEYQTRLIVEARPATPSPA